MKLAIVISKGQENEVGRICTSSQMADVLKFLQLLGVDKWELDTKGSARLFTNGPDLYVAIGPVDFYDTKSFLKEVEVGIADRAPR